MKLLIMDEGSDPEVEGGEAMACWTSQDGLGVDAFHITIALCWSTLLSGCGD